MENDYLLDTNMETISPPSSPKDQSPNSFSRDLIGRLGIISQGTETIINETQKASLQCIGAGMWCNYASWLNVP